MKLESIKIQNFRSIALTKMVIDEKLTAIIGGNEHGKTNLLSAIKLLDFETPIRFIDRRVERTSTSESSSRKSTSLIYDIKFSENELEYMKSFILSKTMNKGERPSLDDAKEKFYWANKKIEIAEDIHLQIDYKDGKKNEYNVIDVADKDLSKFLLDFIKTTMASNVFYFDTFGEYLKHKIPKEEIIYRTDNITNGLIKLAGLKGKEKAIFKDTPKARHLLNDGSEKLTENLRKIWLQGREDEVELVLSISNDGRFLTIDIGDPNTYGAVSTRSRGFLFFISFILKFKECNDGDFKDLIILIDEPGMFLHPKGQKNLLDYLQSLAEYNQVLYTTHSPFMINRLRGNTVRIAVKTPEHGTTVNSRPHGNIDEAFLGGD